MVWFSEFNENTSMFLENSGKFLECYKKISIKLIVLCNSVQRVISSSCYCILVWRKMDLTYFPIGMKLGKTNRFVLF